MHNFFGYLMYLFGFCLAYVAEERHIHCFSGVVVVVGVRVNFVEFLRLDHFQRTIRARAMKLRL